MALSSAPPEAGPPSATTTGPARGGALARAYYELTKPGIALSVMLTTGASFYVAAAGRPDLGALLNALGGTGLATAGALALNQYVERDLDGRMKRTRFRPIPSGRVTPGSALAFGLVLLVIGVAWLALTVGGLPAALTLASAAAYILLYTPLKRKSYLATLVGGVPGALPALIGWSAAAGSLAIGAWVLGGIYFLWQLPHVLALAWLLRDDYREVGFFLMPPTDPDGRRIARHMVHHSLSLLFLSLVPTLMGLTGWIYGTGVLVLGAGMLAVTGIAAREEMALPHVRRVFFASLLYQPLLLALILIDTVRT